MSDIEVITQALDDFRRERDWAQFHNPKDLAIAISVESAELLELFLWKQSTEVTKEKIEEELADILSFALLLAMEKGIDITDCILQKISKNALKYPVNKAKGNARKYNEL
jgi:NTP pyrophosphatase (non-canonical NTP hydrolase)